MSMSFSLAKLTLFFFFGMDVEGVLNGMGLDGILLGMGVEEVKGEVLGVVEVLGIEEGLHGKGGVVKEDTGLLGVVFKVESSVELIKNELIEPEEGLLGGEVGSKDMVLVL